jgi:hypothetical protein
MMMLCLRMLRILSARTVLSCALLFTTSATLQSHPPSSEVIKMFPADVGAFHLSLSIRPLLTLEKQGLLRLDYFPPSVVGPGASQPILGGEAEYSSANGDKLLVELVKFQSDSSAYSMFTMVAKSMRESEQLRYLAPNDVGIAAFASPRSVAFSKGTVFGRITNETSNKSELSFALARSLAAALDNGEGDIPVLVKHLPDWQSTQPNAVYAVTANSLTGAVANQPILNEISFEGNTQAVAAHYGQSQLVIVEFTTPQLAGENDRRITPKIEELRSQGQQVPSAYRRVGNYSVFVFNAPDEKTANQLIDQVKYEQVVQWLGDNPYWYEKAVREWAQTSAGVMVTVLKSSGLSLLICLGTGGVIGALLFRRRRALQRQAALYSDAGGMVRLNLDEINGVTDSSRLLKDSRKH